MRIAVPRTRRTMTRVLSGIALATLLAVSTGNAALGGTPSAEAGASTASPRTDVFLKDITTDTGLEPHGYLYSSFFNSPDISICPPRCSARPAPTRSSGRPAPTSSPTSATQDHTGRATATAP